VGAVQKPWTRLAGFACQQTLHHALGWSFNLLSSEQRVFVHLGILRVGSRPGG
jgi:hypothetical protein